MNEDAGEVSFALELTTPACPIKDQFEREARDNVESISWVKKARVRMTAQSPKPITAANVRSGRARARDGDGDVPRLSLTPHLISDSL